MGFIDRLKHTRVKGGDTVVKGAKKVGKEVSNFSGKVSAAREEYAVRKQEKKLVEYKNASDRRSMAEIRTYGRELSADERKKFETYSQKVEKEKNERRTRLVGQFTQARPDLRNKPARPRSTTRSRRGRQVVYVQQAPPSGFDILLGTTAQPPAVVRRAGTQPKDLSFGGLLGPAPTKFTGRGRNPLSPGGLL